MDDNVQQAVPFFAVRDMVASLAFYVDGLGFEVREKWLEEGVLRWCSLGLGSAEVMLQELRSHELDPDRSPGQGVTICFYCKDALSIYRQAEAAGLEPKEPFVGNSMWVTSLRDPDGFRIEFESMTDVPEETRLSEWQGD